ncbi:MFS transporter [Pseudomonas edaphica]|uniref:MFS transporter n=1 Tax=Pseudomonas edaphica TaxID=2006980 RepID=UPI003D0FA2C8
MNKSHISLVGGFASTALGVEFMQVAVPVLASAYLNLTTTQTGMVLATRFLPVFLIGLFVGALLDRVYLPLILRLFNLLGFASAVLFAVLMLCGHAGVGMLMLLTFMIGTIKLVTDTASAAIVPLLVEKQHFLNLNSTLISSQSVAKLLAPLMAGTALSWWGAGYSMLLQAGAFLLAVLLFSGLRVVRGTNVAAAVSTASLVGDVREGILLIFSNRNLRWLILTACLWNFIAETIISYVLVYSTQVLSLSAVDVGGCVSAGGAAFLAGSLSSRYMLKFVSFKHAIIASMFAPVVAGGVLISLNITGIYPVVMVCAVFVSMNYAASVHMISSLSERQIQTPSFALGRVQSASRLMMSGVMPFASIMGASLLHFKNDLFALVGILLISFLLLGIVVVLSATTQLQRSNN